MKINKILWEFKEFFMNGPLPRLMFVFIFIIIMVETILPKIENLFLKIFLSIFTLLFACAIILDGWFKEGLLKEPKENDKKTKRKI